MTAPKGAGLTSTPPLEGPQRRVNGLQDRLPCTDERAVRANPLTAFPRVIRLMWRPRGSNTIPRPASAPIRLHLLPERDITRRCTRLSLRSDSSRTTMKYQMAFAALIVSAASAGGQVSHADHDALARPASVTSANGVIVRRDGIRTVTVTA